MIVGQFPAQEQTNGRLHSRSESIYSKNYGSSSLYDLKEIAGTEFSCVMPRRNNVGKTILSWDQRPPAPFRENPEAHLFSVLYLERFYSDIMSDCEANVEEICDYIDWTKSPGFPYTYLGFRSKQELVPFLETDSNFINRTDTVPVYSVSGKVEFLPTKEIENEKIRIFQIPPFPLLWSQLKFGKRISNKMLCKEWSYYGFNPYRGGFHNLAERLLEKPYRGCYDVSGWDKFIPLLPDVYGVLHKYSGLKGDSLQEFLWMMTHTIKYHLRLPNGNLVLKDYGNASGTGTTTRDNIFCHILIFAAGLYKAYKEDIGNVDLEVHELMMKISSQVVCLYGDDNVFSVDEEFKYICEPEFLAAHLAEYGLKLKFFHGGKDASLTKLSFLGAEFVEKEGVWLPKYNAIRLATTMVYEHDTTPPSAFVSRAFTLMVMSFPTEHYQVFKAAYANLVKSDFVQKQQSDSVIKSYAFLGVPEDAAIMAFYTGAESDVLSRHFNFFYMAESDIFEAQLIRFKAMFQIQN